MNSRLALACCVFLLSGVGRVWAADGNEILEALIKDGVKFNETRSVRMSAPTMPDGLNAAAQKKVLASIADDNHPVEALMRRALVAPFVLRINDEKISPGAAPRRVDLWFVTYADLEKISDESFLKQHVEAESKTAKPGSTAADGQALTDEQLKERNITAADGEHYLAGAFSLFDRVRLSGVTRAKLTRSADSVTLAGVLDPQFAKDPKYPNSWRSLNRDDNGELTTGAPHPYSAAGWYVKATRLAEPKGAIFVEYHATFDEPQGWFNGANLLRSKLPIVAQDGVRQFRRRMNPAGSEQK